MNRREFFLKARLPVATACLLGPASGLASSELKISDFAGGLFLTSRNPGRWHNKIISHLPEIQLTSNTAKTELKIITTHSFTGYKHYIVKHMLLDSQLQFVAEHMFDPMNDNVAISDFSMERYTGELYALSVCNKHDTWLSSITIS